MSFIIVVYCSEGIVMASDSRSSYDNKTQVSDKDGNLNQTVIRHGVHFTDTVYKTFVTENKVGISTCGDSSIMGLPIAGYIESFIRENQSSNVDAIPTKLLDYFKDLDKNLSTIFLVAGYSPEEDLVVKQKLYEISIKGNYAKSIEINKPGATWSGEQDVLIRLINPVAQLTPEGPNELPNHEILWQFFNLQDAIDFAEYAIQATIDTMRFQSRGKTVGGPIDILVIKPEEAKWMARKELHA